MSENSIHDETTIHGPENVVVDYKSEKGKLEDKISKDSSAKVGAELVENGKIEGSAVKEAIKQVEKDLKSETVKTAQQVQSTKDPSPEQNKQR